MEKKSLPVRVYYEELEANLSRFLLKIFRNAARSEWLRDLEVITRNEPI